MQLGANPPNVISCGGSIKTEVTSCSLPVYVLALKLTASLDVYKVKKEKKENSIDELKVS